MQQCDYYHIELMLPPTRLEIVQICIIRLAVSIFIIIIGYVIFNSILKIKITESFVTNNIFNNIYINLSILFFYFFPFFFLNIKNLNKFKKFFVENRKFYFLSSLILFILYTKFNYSGLGGGF